MENQSKAKNKGWPVLKNELKGDLTIFLIPEPTSLRAEVQLTQNTVVMEKNI